MYSQKQLCLLTFFDSFQSHFLLSLFETIKERRTEFYLDIRQCQERGKTQINFKRAMKITNP